MLLLVSSFAWPAAAQEATRRPTREQLEAVCTYLAAVGSRELVDHTLRGGVFDIDGDGDSEIVRPTWQGSMNIQTFEIRERDGTERFLRDVGFEWKDSFAYGARWLVYDGRAYVIYFAQHTATVPRYLTYVEPNNEMRLGCEFRTSIHARLSPRVIRPGTSIPSAMCEAVERGTVTYLRPSAVEVAAVTVATPNATYRTGSLTVDYDNDGEPSELALLDFTSGRGRGCGSDYFDLPEAINEPGPRRALMSGRPELPETPRDLLLALQDVVVESDSVRVPNCRSPEVRWFEFDGRVFFENRFNGRAPEDDSDAIHWVRTIDEGAVVTACTSYFDYAVEVESVRDPAVE